MSKTYKIDGAEYIFHQGEIIDETKLQRVHAVLLTPDGRVLLRIKGGGLRATTGGHIDLGDRDLESALRREVKEEVNCEIDRLDWLGYVVVTEPDGQREIWARMVARVSEILPAKPDPDRKNHWIYGRILAPECKAIDESSRDFPLNHAQIREAFRVARAKNYFTKLQNDKYEIINAESLDSND